MLDMFFITLICFLDWFLRSKTPTFQIIAYRPNRNIKPKAHLYVKLYRLAGPKRKRQFQLVWTFIHQVSTDSFLFMGKQSPSETYSSSSLPHRQGTETIDASTI